MLHGNGFIAAFVGGLAFGTAGGRRGERLVPFVEETGALVSLLVWLAFGAVAVVPALRSLTWQTILYGVLSLTVIRMLPVAIALAGVHLSRATVAFVAGLVPAAWHRWSLPWWRWRIWASMLPARGRGYRLHRAAQRGRARRYGRSPGPQIRAAGVSRNCRRRGLSGAPRAPAYPPCALTSHLWACR
jgi:hypothetical protein